MKGLFFHVVPSNRVVAKKTIANYEQKKANKGYRRQARTRVLSMLPMPSQSINIKTHARPFLYYVLKEKEDLPYD